MAQSAALIGLCGSAERLRASVKLLKIAAPMSHRRLCGVLAAHESFSLYGIKAKTMENIRIWFANHKDTHGLGHNNAANKHAAVCYNNADVLGWAIGLLSHPRNYSAATALRYLESRCGLFGYKCPSVRWLQRLRQDEAALLAGYSYDDGNRHKAAYRIYSPMAKAAFGGSRWTIDGTQHNSIVHKSKAGNKHLYWICVRDEFSGDILAWLPCYGEDEANHILVLKHAIEVCGYLPFELRHDRFAGHNSAAWGAFAAELEGLGVRIVKTSSPLGKAAHERSFSTMQSVFDQAIAGGRLSYGDGYNGSRRGSRVRMKSYMAEQRKALAAGWDFEAAVGLLERTVELFRHTKYSVWSDKYKSVDHSPSELHSGCTKPDAVRLQEYQVAGLSWPRTKASPSGGYILMARMRTGRRWVRIRNGKRAWKAMLRRSTRGLWLVRRRSMWMRKPGR